MANCKNCGAAMQEGTEVCAACGATNATANADYLGGKDPLTYALLAGFLGGLGLPFWMLGETKKAIVRLVASLVLGPCTCGLVSIAVIVLNILDAIKLNKGEYVADPEKWI